MANEKERLPWFHCYPEKWLGALQEMGPDLGYTYVIICFRIYEKRGPIPDDVKPLARRIGYRESHVRRLIDELCKRGKLVRQDGALMNPFAEKQIIAGEAKVSQTRAKRSEAAKISWEKRKTKQRPAGAKAKPQHASAKQKPADLDLDKDSEKEKKGKVSKTDSAPAKAVALHDDWPDDYEDQFWDKYPKGRKHDQVTVYGLLFKLRREGFIDAKKKRQRLTWAVLDAGLDRYIASNPGEFVKAPLPWLRGQRWAVTEYPNKGNGNGDGNHGRKPTRDELIIAEARRRAGNGGRNGGSPRPIDPVPSGLGVRDDADRPVGGGRAVLDLKANARS